MDAPENIEGVKDDDIEKYIEEFKLDSEVSISIEKFKLDSEEELLLRVHKLNEQVANEYFHSKFKIPSKPPIKKMSLKMKMLKKLHDHHINFQLKNLHEVVKQLKKLHSNKTMYLQKDTKEAYVRKKENCETREDFEIKRSEILEKLDDSKEGIEEIEIEEIHRMINNFKRKTDFRFNKDLILNLVKVKKLIDYEENRIKEKLANKVETVHSKIQATFENSLKTTVTGDTNRTPSSLSSAEPETKEDSVNGADKKDEDVKKGVLENKRKTEKCCWFCSKDEGSLLKCSGCRKAYYCNEKCIERDWPVHGNWCSKKMQKREERKVKK